MQDASRHWSSRLPFYYGWLIVGIAFVTMAIGVSARTAFSLLMPPLIDEFGWDRGLAAGAFSFGFFASAILSPVIGTSGGRPRAPRRDHDRRRAPDGWIAARALHPAALALLCDARLARWWRRQHDHLFDALPVLAELVRRAARTRDQYRLRGRWRRRHRAAAVAAVDHRHRWLACLVRGHGSARAAGRGAAQSAGAQAAGGHRIAAGRRGAIRRTPRRSARRILSTPYGRGPSGRSRAPCAPPASGGSSSATSARSSPGTPCRCIRRNI